MVQINKSLERFPLTYSFNALKQKCFYRFLLKKSAPVPFVLVV